MPPAPTDATYLLLTPDGTLTEARLWTPGNGLDAVDGGAGGAYTVTVDPAEVDNEIATALDNIGYPNAVLLSALTADGALISRNGGVPVAIAPGAPGQYLQQGAVIPAWATPATRARILSAVTTPIDVVNTAAETDLFNFTVPGGTVAAGDLLRLTSSGDQLQNVGANRTYRIRLYIGGTLAYDATTPGYQLATRGVLNWKWDIYINNPANLATVGGQLLQGSNLNPPTVGLGGLTTAGVLLSFLGTSTKDWGSNQAIRWTVQWSAGATTTSWRMNAAALEHIPV